jgi:hypothetical protein
MRRRALLASTVAGIAGLAGCGGRTGGAPDRDTYDVPVTETSGDRNGGGGSVANAVAPGRPGSVLPPDDAVRSVRRLGREERTMVVGRVPAGTAVVGTTLTVGFTAPPTATSPARVWIGLNNASVADRRIEFGPTPPFSGYRGRTGADAGDLVLVPADGRSAPGLDVVPDGPVDGRWVATGEVPGPAERRDGGTVRTLAGGETVAGEYFLLLAEGTDGLADRGIYRFGPDEASLSVGVAVWDPGLAERSPSTFDRSVPGVPVADETEWFHDGGRTTFLAPERESLVLPRDRAAFRLRNLSERPVTAGEADWDLYRLEGGWRRIATGAGDRVDRLPAGGERTLSLGVAGEGRAPPAGGGGADVSTSVAGLSPGLYAVRFGAATVGDPRGRVNVHGDTDTYVWTPPPAPDEEDEGFPSDESVAYAALVRVAPAPTPPDA